MGLFKPIGVELRLMPAKLGLHRCLFGFNNREWISIVVPKYIIGIADAGFGGLMLHLDLFAHLRGGDIPPRACKQAIYQPCARCCFIKRQLIGRCLGRCCNRRKLFRLLFGSLGCLPSNLELAQQSVHLCFLRSELFKNLAALARLGSLRCRR